MLSSECYDYAKLLKEYNRNYRSLSKETQEIFFQNVENCYMFFDCYALADTIWMMAKVELKVPEHLRNKIEHRLIILSQSMFGKNVSKLIWGFGKMYWLPRNGVLDMLVEQFEKGICESSAQTISNVVWGLARLNVWLVHESIRQLEKRVLEICDVIDGQHIANILWAYALQKQKAGRLVMEVFKCIIIEKIKTFRGQELCMIMWYYGRVCCIPENTLLECIEEQILRQKKKLNTKGHIMLLSSYAMLKLKCKDEFICQHEKFVDGNRATLNHEDIRESIRCYLMLQTKAPFMIETIVEEHIQTGWSKLENEGIIIFLQGCLSQILFLRRVTQCLLLQKIMHDFDSLSITDSLIVLRMYSYLRITVSNDCLYDSNSKIFITYRKHSPATNTSVLSNDTLVVIEKKIMSNKLLLRPMDVCDILQSYVRLLRSPPDHIVRMIYLSCNMTSVALKLGLIFAILEACASLRIYPGFIFMLRVNDIIQDNTLELCESQMCNIMCAYCDCVSMARDMHIIPITSRISRLRENLSGRTISKVVVFLATTHTVLHSEIIQNMKVCIAQEGNHYSRSELCSMFWGLCVLINKMHIYYTDILNSLLLSVQKIIENKLYLSQEDCMKLHQGLLILKVVSISDIKMKVVLELLEKTYVRLYAEKATTLSSKALHNSDIAATLTSMGFSVKCAYTCPYTRYCVDFICSFDKIDYHKKGDARHDCLVNHFMLVVVVYNENDYISVSKLTKINLIKEEQLRFSGYHLITIPRRDWARQVNYDMRVRYIYKKMLLCE